MNTHVCVDAKYEERIQIKHLSMEPALQGAKTTFAFEDHQINITLPHLPPEDKRGLYDPYAEAEADVWKAETGEVINVHIYTISIAIVGLNFEIPAVAAAHQHINASLYNDSEARDLDERSDQLYFLARRALDYWLRIVRWKTELGLIDIDTRPDRGSLFGGRLFNTAHSGAFYCPRVGRTAVAPKRCRLNPEIWHKIVTAVSAGLTPPIWNEYLMSAHRRIDNGDLIAATIDLAIAAESLIRPSLDRQLPATTPNWTRNAVARTQLANVINRWTEYDLPAVSQSEWFGTIRTLMEIRNGLLHRGNDQRVQISFCRDAASAVEKLAESFVT